ncbi:hypothetical protein SAMN05216167_10181 [Spirosoma endophyticum]|uniref:Uncharacterized protein n=1 Tax=Spirosoma endophyticum TaxID=662367 RepID=A0A1I1EXF1_9BACT|nr:hypothetical protein SAMN05216167_10181 [Spirosoma endophyticum]
MDSIGPMIYPVGFYLGTYQPKPRQKQLLI